MIRRLVERVRKPKLFDVIMYEGRYHTVVEIRYPGGVRLEPLMDTLTRNMLVEGESKEYITLRDALLMDGWSPPDE